MFRFFNFGAPGKKKSSTTTPPIFPATNVGAVSCLGEMRGIDDLVIMTSGGTKGDLISRSSQDTDKLSALGDCPYR